MPLRFPVARLEAIVAANETCAYNRHMTSNERRCMSQIWKRIGSRGTPFKSDWCNDH